MGEEEKLEPERDAPEEEGVRDDAGSAGDWGDQGRWGAFSNRANFHNDKLVTPKHLEPRR